MSVLLTGKIVNGSYAIDYDPITGSLGIVVSGFKEMILWKVTLTSSGKTFTANNYKPTVDGIRRVILTQPGLTNPMVDVSIGAKA